MKSRVCDDLGNKWKVEKNQPGYEAVKKLEKAGFQWIVLPMEMLVGKDTVGLDLDYPDIVTEADTTQVLRIQRLRDCIGVLEGRVMI